ncbi:hypothetical protein F383_12020 [Gossypium arboreum]|uniref:Uncharacterized protein n=1 Tax=Gossypium arboreum TaxID=29729 RepID=A0A0B0NI37_GOSAR|nr:hypothetical protein F383_12020 [Gossypium arboreum]
MSWTWRRCLTPYLRLNEYSILFHMVQSVVYLARGSAEVRVIDHTMNRSFRLCSKGGK